MQSPLTHIAELDHLACCIAVQALHTFPTTHLAEGKYLVMAQVCERFSLPEVKESICQRIGMARLQQGRLACALRWLGSCASEQALAPLGQQLAVRIAEHASQPSTAAWPGNLSLYM